ncbi:MAG TPA: M48 family metallopeptidase [Thermoanaerobaculia bacterium]|jgi:Zn-dependent protease with chaperone function|nr:M48 family metallopeptidase [Thermoanaerobaculia bacterium]
MDGARKRLTGLRPQRYEHPLDSQALNLLENTAGLDLVVRKCNEWGFERLLRVQLTGSHLRVNADTFSDIHEMVVEACDILDIPTRPDVYIAPGEINAFTAGSEKPILVLTAGAIDSLSDIELFFVIAHELGHIKSGHVLYYSIAEYLPVVAQIIGNTVFGLGAIFSAALQVALVRFKQMAELTADRAGLLACQDANAAIGAMMKLAGLPSKYYDAMNTEDFVAQAREFTALDTDKLNWFAKWLSAMGQTHPWTVLRASQFLAWIDSGDYDSILSTAPEVSSLTPASTTSHCTRCGRPLTGKERFCPGCGNAIASVSAAITR